jgi:hypothetical protein
MVERILRMEVVEMDVLRVVSHLAAPSDATPHLQEMGLGQQLGLGLEQQMLGLPVDVLPLLLFPSASL